jgi:hypothetical protein
MVSRLYPNCAKPQSLLPRKAGVSDNDERRSPHCGTSIITISSFLGFRLTFLFLRAYIQLRISMKIWKGSMFRKSLALSGLKTSAVVCLLFVTMIAVFSLSGCGGSSKPVSVAVAASSTTVDATDAVTLTATVANDKSPGGVTWAVSGGGTLSNQTTAGATFTAPAASNSALTVTVTATSVADTSK